MLRTGLKTTFIFLFALGLTADGLLGQIPRRRANPNAPVDEVFWAPSIIGMSSVTNIPKGNLNVTILHAFGIATNGIEDLWGLDASANIRFGVDYGLHDRLSVGFARSRFDKLYDFRMKANLLRQTRNDSIPIEIAVKGDFGIQTTKNGFGFADRLSYFISLMFARKLSERVSVQISPMFSHFNTVFIEEENDHFAVGLVARYVIGDRMSLMVEYVPVLGKRSDGTRNALSMGLNIETGGHVFQLFLKTSQWLTEQHIISRNTDNFLDGDFRFGFNVNRVFGVGQ